MAHTTRATLCAALLGLALSGPAGPSRLLADVQAWLTALWSDAGSIMDPNGQGDAGGLMDPDGLQGDAGGIMDPNG